MKLNEFIYEINKKTKGTNWKEIDVAIDLFEYSHTPIVDIELRNNNKLIVFTDYPILQKKE